jgi:hypothetical protein
MSLLQGFHEAEMIAIEAVGDNRAEGYGRGARPVNQARRDWGFV